MRAKRAVISVELVDESTQEADLNIARELSDWFAEEGNVIPWVKSIREVVVKSQ